MAEAESKIIIEELRAIRKDISYIKEHIEEMSLTPDEEEALSEAMVEHREGKAVSLAEFKKHLGE